MLGRTLRVAIIGIGAVTAAAGARAQQKPPSPDVRGSATAPATPAPPSPPSPDVRGSATAPATPAPPSPPPPAEPAAVPAPASEPPPAAAEAPPTEARVVPAGPPAPAAGWEKLEKWRRAHPRPSDPAEPSLGGEVFDFSRKMFLTLGLDGSISAIEERKDATNDAEPRKRFGQLGGSLSFVPLVTKRAWWLGIAGGYQYAFSAKLHRVRAALELGRGPLGVELGGLRLLRGDARAYGMDATVFLVIPAWYTRTHYSASCCQNLAPPLDALRSCACDRTIFTLHVVPYVRFERTLRAARVGRPSEWTTFFGLEVKGGVGF